MLTCDLAPRPHNMLFPPIYSSDLSALATTESSITPWEQLFFHITSCLAGCCVNLLVLTIRPSARSLWLSLFAELVAVL